MMKAKTIRTLPIDGPPRVTRTEDVLDDGAMSHEERRKMLDAGEAEYRTNLDAADPQHETVLVRVRRDEPIAKLRGCAQPRLLS